MRQQMTYSNEGPDHILFLLNKTVQRDPEESLFG